jgi:hypothetical protein
MWEKLIVLIERLSETYLLTFLLLLCAGVVFLALGATGGLPQFAITVSEPFWRNVLGLCGIVFLTAALVFAFVGSKTPARKSLDKAGVEVSIDRPQDGETVKVPYLVSGRCKKLPKGAKLWLFIIGGQGKATKYWAHREIEVKGDVWDAELHAAERDDGKKKRFAVFMVGEDGEALIHHYTLAGEAVRAVPPASNDRDWPGIQVRTSDMIPVTDTRQVTVMVPRAA